MASAATRGGGGTAGGQTLLTRYLIFKTDADGAVLTRVGEYNAKGSEEALRLFFSEPLAENDGLYAAVSENHFKIRPVNARVKTTIGAPADWPPLPAPDISVTAPEAP